MLKITINYHSAVDVITNSSSEIFCEVTSDNFIDIIVEDLTRIFGGAEIAYEPEDLEDDPTLKQAVRFWVEYGDNETITTDFCLLLDAYLSNLVGKENFKIDRDVCC